MPQIIDGNRAAIACTQDVVIVHFDLILDPRGDSDIYIVGRDEHGMPAQSGNSPVLYTYSIAGNNPFGWLKDLSLFSYPEFDLLGDWNECDAYALILAEIPSHVTRIDFAEAMIPKVVESGYRVKVFDKPEDRPVLWRGALIRSLNGWRFEPANYLTQTNLKQLQLSKRNLNGWNLDLFLYAPLNK